MTKEAVWEQYGRPSRLIRAHRRRRGVFTDRRELRPRGGGSLQVAVHQLWMVPVALRRRHGRHMEWKTILENPMDYPYEHGNLPFVEFDCFLAWVRARGARGSPTASDSGRLQRRALA